MPKSRSQKEEIVQDIVSALQTQTGISFVDFSGLRVKDMTDLRKRVKASGGRLIVAKKTLLQRAFQEKNIAIDFANIEGEIAAVFSFQDPLAPLKALSEFAEAHEHLKLKAGYLESALLDERRIVELAALPPLEQLRGQFVGLLASPLSGSMNVLQGTIKGLLLVLRQLKTSD